MSLLLDKGWRFHWESSPRFGGLTVADIVMYLKDIEMRLLENETLSSICSLQIFWDINGSRYVNIQPFISARPISVWPEAQCTELHKLA